MQSKLGSFIESIIGTLTGLLIAFFATRYLMAAYHVPIDTVTNIKITAWMTLISVIRSYVFRRVFNSNFWKGFRE